MGDTLSLIWEPLRTPGSTPDLLDLQTTSWVVSEAELDCQHLDKKLNVDHFKTALKKTANLFIFRDFMGVILGPQNGSSWKGVGYCTPHLCAVAVNRSSAPALYFMGMNANYKAIFGPTKLTSLKRIFRTFHSRFLFSLSASVIFTGIKCDSLLTE